MKLLIISHTPHYKDGAKFYGWGATVREICYLASHFSHIVHIAPLYKGSPDRACLPYERDNIQTRFVSSSGGKGIKSKLKVLIRYFEYYQVIIKEISNVDLVHVRCPSNIGLLALVMLCFIKKPKKRWVKYAGSWTAYSKEPLSYKLQKLIISKNWMRGKVSVNGNYTNQPKHIYSFLNPCLTEEEVKFTEKIAASKTLKEPIKLLFVGRLEKEKGVQRSLEILNALLQHKVNVRLDLVGDGPQKEEHIRYANQLGVQKHVLFQGWLSRREINAHYEGAHFILLPSECSEGWPKVISEAMAYGVIPIVSRAGSIGKYLDEFGLGKSIYSNNINDYSRSIKDYLDRPEIWKREMIKGVEKSRLFTYKAYIKKLEENIINGNS